MEDKTERATATHTVAHASRYILDPEEQSHQFFHVYQNRMRQLRPALVERIKVLQAQLGTNEPIEERVLDLRMGVPAYVIGAVFKEMPLKPSVLREYTKEQAILLVPEKENFVSPKDTMILEDEAGRIKLVIDDHDLINRNVTGAIVAIHGFQTDGGAFKVDAIYNPEWAPQEPRLAPSTERKYVALTSGLNIGTPTSNPLLASLFLDFIAGHFDSLAARIVRVILAGNTFCSEEDVPAQSKLRDHTKSFSALDQARLEIILRETDSFVYSLACAAPVDVMPGPKDPSNYSLPQQPLNRCLFPRAATLTTLGLEKVTNPYSAVIDGVDFLGHCGQPTQNILNYVTMPEGEDGILDIMEKTLEWRHLAPTAPDTLSSYPFKMHDPFVVERTPHVFFVSNQERFEAKRVSGPNGQTVVLVSVPDFCKTRTFVLLDLNTLDCHPVTVGTWDD